MGEVLREDIVGIATELLGSRAVRYTHKQPELGQSPEMGFDCSGFVRYVLLQAGLRVPDYVALNGSQRPIRHADEFWDHYGVQIHASTKREGDLIFFSREGWWPTHIGIVLSETQYIHSPGKDGAVVEKAPIQQSTIAPSLSLDRRRLYTSNPIGYKTPVVPHAIDSYRVHQNPLN